MEIIKNFVLFYILIGFLLQILGDFKLNRYVRFFTGIIFLLLIMSPIYEWITKENVAQKIEVASMWREYEQARDYDQMLMEYQDMYTGVASDIVIEEMRQTLLQEGYEIKEYEIRWDEEYKIAELELYVGLEGMVQITETMSNTGNKAKELKEHLIQIYEPEFVLEVYCNE